MENSLEQKLIDALEREVRTLRELISAKDALITELRNKPVTIVTQPYWVPYYQYPTYPQYHYQPYSGAGGISIPCGGAGGTQSGIVSTGGAGGTLGAQGCSNVTVTNNSYSNGFSGLKLVANDTTLVLEKFSKSR